MPHTENYEASIGIFFTSKGIFLVLHYKRTADLLASDEFLAASQFAAGRLLAVNFVAIDYQSPTADFPTPKLKPA
jgi:hypothetical protein